MDSPAKQLLDELHLRHRDGEKRFKRKLDDASADQERTHKELLAHASAEHKRVRLNAERTRERFLLEQEQARQTAEEQQQWRLEKARAKLAEKERQAALNEEQRERERIRLEHEDLERRRRLEEERRALERARQVEGERLQRQRQEDERRAAEEKAAREKAQQEQAETKPAAAPQPQVNGAGPAATQASSAATEASFTSSLQIRKALHSEYLALHKRLKELRKTMTQLGKQDKTLKEKMGDGRRAIIKTVGQMNTGASHAVKDANRERGDMIRALLTEALQYNTLKMDVRNFIIPSRQVSYSDAEAQVSGLFLYLLNQVSKCVIRQFVGDASMDPAKAEPVGLFLVSGFAWMQSQWKVTTCLTDILLAKYHRMTPALFGVYTSVPKGFSQEYGDQMTGLAGGFAAITLRDFSKAKSENPFPPSIFWQTLAMIVNTPQDQVRDTHFIVLKALLDPVYVDKFVRFYGDIGISLLRRAVLVFPAPFNSTAANGVKILPDIYKRDLKLVLQ